VSSLRMGKQLDANVPETAEAFALWVAPVLGTMTRLAARLGRVEEQDDIVQEALIRAWSKRRQFDPARGRLSAWLLAIVANEARKTWRRGRAATLTGGNSKVRLLDEALDLEHAISRLASRQRLAVDCFYFAGLSIEETAAVMQCSPGTVKSTLSDARSRLRSLLGQG
jgi:RNA polymerase sigma factor (sigma-70 family)